MSKKKLGTVLIYEVNGVKFADIFGSNFTYANEAAVLESHGDMTAGVIARVPLTYEADAEFMNLLFAINDYVVGSSGRFDGSFSELLADVCRQGFEAAGKTKM